MGDIEFSAIEFSAIDRRTIKVRFPLVDEGLDKLGDALKEAAADGYRLDATRSLMSGHQRDEYAVGVEITLARGSDAS